jgi:general secretion pathway protein G
MKKAFTMIELVFVIVILGILASVAIPKLSATRDDAEIMAGVQRVSSLISDIGSYYTAHGNFAEVNKMSNEELLKADLTKFDGNLTGTTAYFGNTARTKKCLSITIDDMNGTLNITDLNEPSSFCKALGKQLGEMVGSHQFGGSAIYK